jgi:hypothetical protein
MTVLRPNPITVRQFNIFDGAYVAEISSTHGFGRVYDDACDAGLTLVTEDGTEIVYVVNRTHVDADGDITHWTLVPALGPSNLTMTLFND